MCTAIRLILIHKSDGKKSVTIINKRERIYIEGKKMAKKIINNENCKIPGCDGKTKRGTNYKRKKREAKALLRRYLFCSCKKGQNY